MKTSRRAFLQGSATALAAGLVSTSCFAQNGGNTRALPKDLSKDLLRFDAQAKSLLARMTLHEKIGQMIQAEQDALKDRNDLETYALGSLLSGGSSDPKNGNSASDWADLYDNLQTRAMKTRLGIPILYGIDAVHGHNNVLGAVIFPHNIGLGCTRNPALVERAARVTAEEVRATGVQWAFAPCVAVPRDERWGRTYEGFGETPELARQMGLAAVRGLQGDNLAAPLSVVACAKHFVGDGGTTFGTGTPKGQEKERLLDRGDVRLSEQELRDIHMQGYLPAIQAGVATIMPSYNSWNGVKCSGSKRLLTEILKNELGFQGFLISDYNAINELPGNFKSQIEQSTNAGMDMFMVPTRYAELHRLLMELVQENKVPLSRIDDAVVRILRVKYAIGAMDTKRSQLTDRKLIKNVGSPAHRQVARECVRESVVLLKNTNNLLPLSKRETQIHVGGKSADDMGNQCGGWTIDWQGKSGSVTTGGTTILKAVQNTVSKRTQVTFAPDGSGANGAKVGIVVIGEKPYAETNGDQKDLHLAQEDVAAVDAMKAAGMRVVVVLLSGRPMILDNILDKCDAILAAWLPGTEGQGVADVLFGDFKPTGKLSCSWPRSMGQIPINIGDKNYNPLFPYGFGLTYSK